MTGAIMSGVNSIYSNFTLACSSIFFSFALCRLFKARNPLFLSTSLILVFEDADSLFAGRGNRLAQIQYDISNLMFHINKFGGLVILMASSLDKIDFSVFNSFKFILEFPKPSPTLRLYYLIIAYMN